MKTIRKAGFKIKRFVYLINTDRSLKLQAAFRIEQIKRPVSGKCGENMISQKFQNLLAIALAILSGLFTAYIDSRGGPFHLFITGLLLAFFGAVVSFMQPERVWRWALIIGGCVYIVFLARRIFDEVSLNFLKAVPTFIPAFIGVYCGAFLRKLGLMTKANHAKSH